MKKSAVVLILTAAVLVSVSTGCGRRGTEDAKNNDTDMANTEGTVDNIGTEAASGTENGSSQLQLGSAVEIPESFDGQLAETDAHEYLERVIAAYCNVPEEEYANVRYYYNYVDLNGDSENEILALVLGKNVEGIQGNILLWLDDEDWGDVEDADAEDVEQAFKQVGSPIYISNHMTGGYRDLIIPEYTDIVAGTEGSGLDTVGGGNEAGTDAEVTATGVTGVDVTSEGVGLDGTNAAAGSADASGTGTAGTASGAAGTDSAAGGSDTVGTDSAADGSDAVGTDAQDASSELGIPLIPTEQQYRLLVWNGERYQRLEEGTALFTLEGYEGIAILTNNIESDYVNDNYHFLGEAMR